MKGEPRDCHKYSKVLIIGLKANAAEGKLEGRRIYGTSDRETLLAVCVLPQVGKKKSMAWTENWKIYAILVLVVLVLIYFVLPLLIYLLFAVLAVIGGFVLALLYHPGPYKRRGKSTFPSPPIPTFEAPLSRVKPYPPPRVWPKLFSVNVDSRLQEVLNLTLKHHTIPTYNRIARDQEAFFNSVVPEIWNALAVLVRRMGQMDTMKLVTNDVVEALKAHFQHFRGIHFQEGQGQTTDKFPNLIAFPYLESPEHELLFLRQVSEVLLCVCLPKELLGCTPVRVVIREYLACRIFQPTIEMVCNPDYINQKLLAHLIKREEATKSAHKKFAYNTYEDFIKHIDKCEELNELEEIRQFIITDILQAKAVNKMKTSRSARLHGGQFPIPIPADKVRILMRRDLDVYINQLGTAKTVCERQLRKVGGEHYQSDFSDTMKDQLAEESQSPPPGIPFETIMKNQSARGHLLQFMEKCGFDNWLRFWLDVEGFRTNPPEDIHTTVKSVYNEFLCPTAASIIHADQTVVESIHLCLLTEAQPAASCLPLLFRIQESVYEDINNLFYQNFINSEHYRDLMTAESNAATESGGFPPLSQAASLDLTCSLDESHHKTKLKTLKQQLEEKVDELSLMPEEVRTSSNLAMRKKALEKDRGELQEEIKKLEHYIDHTEEWFGTVGQWSIEIHSVDIPKEEKNCRNPLFILVVHRPEVFRHRHLNQEPPVGDRDSTFEMLHLLPESEQPSHGLESVIDSEDVTSSMSELSDDSANYHSKTGWVLGRYLSEFEELHRKLVEICPELQFPPVPKRFNPFQRLDAQSSYWDKYRTALQRYLCRVIQTERLQESEEVFNFISSASDNIRKTPLPERKNAHRFSLSSVPVMGMFTSNKDQEDAKEDSVAEHMYLLFSEVFELDQWSRVLRKQLVELVQLTYGKSIDRELQESLAWVVSEPMLIFYLETFRDAMWPDGQPAPPSPTRSDEQKAATKEEAKKQFLKSSPQVLQTIMGQRNSQIGFQKIFESLQDPRGNKQLFYSLLEVLLYALIPELKKVEIDDHTTDWKTGDA